MRRRFPGVRDGWARFDGPAGTQMVDTAIDAMATWAASGSNANTGGAFAAADECDALLERARRTGRHAARRAIGRDRVRRQHDDADAGLQPGRRGRRCSPAIASSGPRLDHDANVTPWRLACDQAGAEQVLAPFDPAPACSTPPP